MEPMTEPTTTEPTRDAPRWGLIALAPAGAAWGARAIPVAGREAKHLVTRDGRQGRVLRPAVPARLDVLWDRQGTEGGTKTERDALCDVLNGSRGMEAAQAAYARIVAAGELPDDEDEVFDLVRTSEIVIVARSHGGYVYIGAWFPVTVAP